MTKRKYRGPSDPFKSILTLAAAKSKAEIADAAAHAMAEHCDKRIEKMRHFLRKIDEHAHNGQNGSSNYAMDRLLQIRKAVEIALRV